MADDDDDIKQMAQSHKHYLSAMIAEQEAALSRFQNSTYLSDSGVNNTFSASARRTNSGGTQNQSSLNLSASASPYTFARSTAGGNARTFTAAPTPGYRRPSSPGGSESSANSGSGSGVGVNTTLLQNARRTLAEASTWGDADVGAGIGRSRNMSASSGLSSPHLGSASGPGVNDTALTSITMTSEVEAKLWAKDKQAWERRMAELEDRLKRVNSAAGQPILSTAGQQQFNVPIVNGRGVSAGHGGALALGSNTTSHNVHTSSLVLRLEQELATAVEALVRERTSTAQREQEFQSQLDKASEDLQAKETKIHTLNQKWMDEFEAQSNDFQEQLQKGNQKLANTQLELEQREQELNARTTELKKTTARLTVVEQDLRESSQQLETMRIELEKQIRRGKELEQNIQQQEFEKKQSQADAQLKEKNFAIKLDRLKEEWTGRLERQKEEFQLEKEQTLRSHRQELSESEKKFREVEHDAFILSSELGKIKDQLSAKELELDKTRQQAQSDRQNQEQQFRSEREQLELQTRTTIQKMQGMLDATENLVSETNTKLDQEVRKARDLNSKIETQEYELQKARTVIAEKDSALQSKENKLVSLQAKTVELESTSESNISLVTQLRHSQQTLQEEVQLLQKKLDQRSTQRQEELKAMEAEQKKYREKTRQRIQELEKDLEAQRKESANLESRNETMKNDFDLALTQATSNQEEIIHKLERKVEKLSGKLSTKAEHANINLTEKDRMISSLRSELDRRAHSESLALHQLAELEGKLKKERSRCIELEAKLNHVLVQVPDGVQHQRLLAELAAAKQVATNIQGRYREIQGKFERQSVRQNALEQLLNRLQEEQQHNMYRAPAKTYLAAGANMPLYRPLDSYAAAPSSSALSNYSVDDSILGGVGSSSRPTGGDRDFSMEEEDMYRVLMRDQERQRRVRQHVRAYARGDVSSDDDEPSAPAAARSTYVSRTRSRSVPRDRQRNSDWADTSRTRDDADVNLNLKVNFDPRVLKRMKELDCFPTCVHSSTKPHDTRSCKVCQRRAFGRGLDLNQHYAPSQHLPSRVSPTKSYGLKLPHT